VRLAVSAPGAILSTVLHITGRASAIAGSVALALSASATAVFEDVTVLVVLEEQLA